MTQRPNGALRTILILAGASVALFGTLWGMSLAGLNGKASVECVEAIRADVDDNARDVRACGQITTAIVERLARMEANQERILRKLED
jgi:hypothetical protein